MVVCGLAIKLPLPSALAWTMASHTRTFSTPLSTLVSFSTFDRHDSNKPEMIGISCSLFNRSDSGKPENINISPHYGCYLWTLRDHKTFELIRIKTRLKLKGSEFSWHPILDCRELDRHARWLESNCCQNLIEEDSKALAISSFLEASKGRCKVGR